MKLLEHGRRVYLPRGLKGPAEGGSQAPMTQLSHQVQSCHKDETERKGKPCSLSPQRMTVLSLIVGIMREGTKACSAPKGRSWHHIHGYIWGRGGGGGSTSLRSMAVNKGTVIMDTHGRVPQAEAVEVLIVKIYWEISLHSQFPI